MSFAYWLNTVQNSAPGTTPARMSQQVNVAEQDVWNFRARRYENMVFTKQAGQFSMPSLYRRPARRMAKAVATSRKTASLSILLSKFLLTVPKRRTSCSVVSSLGRNPHGWSRNSPYSLTSLRILASRTFSNSLPTLWSRVICR